MSNNFVPPFDKTQKEWGRKVYSDKLLPGQCEECQHFNFVKGVCISAPDLEDLKTSARNGCALCSVLHQAIELRLPQDGQLLVALSHAKGNARLEHFKMKYTRAGMDGICSTEFEVHRSIEVQTTEVGGKSIAQNYKDTTHLGPGRELPTNTSSEASMLWLKAQVDQCDERHSSCNARAGPESRPRRLLYLSKDLMDPVRLVETMKTVEYVCLSHCWGPRPLIRTLKSNIGEYKRAIRRESLPRTFQNAVEVTLSPGLEYIWIDSLCIVQDDADDWAIESAKMAAIYQYAYITIAATGAVDSSVGLFFETPREHYSTKLVPSVNAALPFDVYTRKPVLHFYSLHDQKALENQFPLLTRAWCYQERLLSSRIVHFTKTELVWECHEETACECCGSITTMFDTEVQPKLTHNLSATRQIGPQNTLTAEWRRMVESFSSLNLTYASDIFPALSGGAKQIWQLSGDVYIAGLWKSTFFSDLLWQCDMTAGLAGTTRRVGEWRAPMFSWASVTGRVHYPYPVPVYTPLCFSDIPEGHEALESEPKWAGKLESGCELLDFECSMVTSDPTGRLDEASVTVRGPLVDCLLWGTWSKSKNTQRVLEYSVRSKRVQIGQTESRGGRRLGELTESTDEPQNRPNSASAAEDPQSTQSESIAAFQETLGDSLGGFFPDWELSEPGSYWAATAPGMNVSCLLVGKDDKLTRQRAVVFGETARGFERLGVLWYKSYEEMLGIAEIQTITLV